MRLRNRNICGYWDCKSRIPDDDFLCDEHHQKWVDGLIDRCPKCGRFKDIMYQMCLDCYFGRPVKPRKSSAVIPTPKRRHRVEYSDAWVDGYMRPDKFFVYILELDAGVLYVGHTADLRKQLSASKEAKMLAAAQRQSKLQYAQVIATKLAAEEREAELERLIKSNPDQMRLMIADFHGHMRVLGFE